MISTEPIKSIENNIKKRSADAKDNDLPEKERYVMRTTSTTTVTSTTTSTVYTATVAVTATSCNKKINVPLSACVGKRR